MAILGQKKTPILVAKAVAVVAVVVFAIASSIKCLGLIYVAYGSHILSMVSLSMCFIVMVSQRKLFGSIK